MITIITANIDEKKIESHVNINGSAKDIIADFYSLQDVFNKNSEIKLLYDIAIKKWELDHENN